MNRIKAALASGAILAAGAGTLAACGGGGPQSASDIVKSDGYTPISLSALGSSSADIGSSFPSGDVASLAFGVSDSDSSKYQLVVVTTSQGQSDIASTGAVSSEESAVDSTGASLTYSGGVIVITGTADQFGSIPGN